MTWNFGLELGSTLGSFVGAIASNASSRKQYKYQSRLQAQAAQLNYDYGQKSLLNSPTSQRQGLENAGYNPMLAVQNATSGANAGWTTTGQAQNIDYAGDIASGLSNALNVQNMKNQTAQTESQIDLQHAQAQEFRQRTLNEHLREPFITPRERAELQKTNSEINNLQADSSLKEATIQNLKDRLQLDSMLGFAGLDVKRYGIDKAYNASTYATDSKFASDIYGIDVTHPYSSHYVGSLFNSGDVSEALYKDIRKNAYRHPKYR